MSDPTDSPDSSQQSSPSGAAPNVARLDICSGDFAGTSYPLVSEETIIGRSPTTDITLLDDGISREHALILLDAESGSGEHSIEDLQSTNGTKVNGKRIRSATLHDGDEIRIGQTDFRYKARSG